MTREQLAQQLYDAHHIAAQPISVEGGRFTGVNVWSEPTDRYPWSTVWFPLSPEFDPEGNSADYVWGPAFEYGAPADSSVEQLAAKVAETMAHNGSRERS